MDWTAAMVDLLLWVLVIGAVAAAGYLLLLTCASVLPRRRRAYVDAESVRFAFVVPAHNEEKMLGRTLESLRNMAFESDSYSIHVIADNCTDKTAYVARGYGVTVHDRSDPANPGKGQALDWFLKTVAVHEEFDAVVFIDADTVVDSDFLAVSKRYLNSGYQVLQASYRVRDPESSPVVGLRALAFSLFHDLRGRGKSRLGLSCGLWGNGMVFRREILSSIPWESFTAVEDAEQHLRLLLSGINVGFMEETHVSGHMPASLAGAKEQQRRWEAGRLSLARRFAASLILEAIKARRPALVLALLEIALPPLSVHAIGNLAIVGFALGLGSSAQVAVSLGCLGALATYVLVGLLRADVPARTYLALFYAPIYIVWKLSLFAVEFLRRRSPEWVRTVRDRQTSAP